MLHHGGGHIAEQTDLVLVGLFSCLSSNGTAENVLVLLLWEVHIIVSVRMRVLSWVVSVILPGGVGPQVRWVAESPVLDAQIRHRFALVVVANLHGSLISLVIDGLSSQIPLSLLPKSLEHMVWADLHDRDFFVQASALSLAVSARVELPDLSVATSWDLAWFKNHILSVLSVWVAETTVLMTKSLVLSIGIPVIMGLVVPVVLVQRVVQVTIDPTEGWNVAEVEWHLGEFARSVLVPLSDRVELLIEVGVHELVAPVPVRSTLVPIPLGHLRVVEVHENHI